MCGVVNNMNFERAADFVAALSMSTSLFRAMLNAWSQLDTGTILKLIASSVSSSFR